MKFWSTRCVGALLLGLAGIGPVEANAAIEVWETRDGVQCDVRTSGTNAPAGFDVRAGRYAQTGLACQAIDEASAELPHRRRCVVPTAEAVALCAEAGVTLRTATPLYVGVSQMGSSLEESFSRQFEFNLFGFDPLVDRSLPVSRRVYPATVAFKWTPLVNSQPTYCMATFVGPQAMLTAAHCVPADGSVEMVFEGSKWAMACKRHPSYDDASATCNDPLSPECASDVALCRPHKRLCKDCAWPAPHERLLLLADNTLLAPDAKIRLVGASGAGLEHACARIQALPSVTPKASAAVARLIEIGYPVGSSGPLTAPRDSGGGNMVVKDGMRLVAGATRGGDQRRQTFIVPLSDASVSKFVRDWAMDEQVSTCDESSFANGCRARTATPADCDPCDRDRPCAESWLGGQHPLR
jgi:hypothetical protein